MDHGHTQESETKTPKGNGVRSGRERRGRVSGNEEELPSPARESSLTSIINNATLKRKQKEA